MQIVGDAVQGHDKHNSHFSAAIPASVANFGFDVAMSRAAVEKVCSDRWAND